MINWTPITSININFHKKLLNNDYNDVLVITNNNDIVYKSKLFNDISIFGPKKNNYHFLVINESYDISVKLILDKIKSFENNNIYAVASSNTTIHLVDAISQISTPERLLKKIIIISPHVLCYNGIMKLKNVNINIIYGENDEIVPINNIESLSYKSNKHVLYSIKYGNHALSNINKNMFKNLIIRLLRN